MTGLVIVAVNLKERTLAGILSQGMVMCATKSDKTNVEILRPPGGICYLLYILFFLMIKYFLPYNFLSKNKNLQTQLLERE